MNGFMFMISQYPKLILSPFLQLTATVVLMSTTKASDSVVNEREATMGGTSYIQQYKCNILKGWYDIQTASSKFFRNVIKRRVIFRVLSFLPPMPRCLAVVFAFFPTN